MITVYPDANRYRSQQTWLTFDPSAAARTETGAFDVIEQLTEHRLAPGESIQGRSQQPCELLTYVCEGGLQFEQSVGRTRALHAGEFHRACGEAGLSHGECRAASNAAARIFQIALRLSAGPIDHRNEFKVFTVAQRRDVPRLVASPSEREDALRLQQNVRVFSVNLLPGRHLVHALGTARSLWVHVVDGSGVLHGTKVAAGDGAGLTGMPSLSFTATTASELLFIEFGGRADVD